MFKKPKHDSEEHITLKQLFLNCKLLSTSTKATNLNNQNINLHRHI